MNRANARDEWQTAAADAAGVLDTATTALAVARRRVNHAAAEGVVYS